jgi:RNA-directed DNA polymerase
VIAGLRTGSVLAKARTVPFQKERVNGEASRELGLMNSKRQNNQPRLAFMTETGSETPTNGIRVELSMAKQEPESGGTSERRMEEICEPGNMRRALMCVQENEGAPGIDGMTVKELPRYLKKNWPKHREELLAGTYKPKPARRKEIPKPDGGKRNLSIPCVLDRMIQQAMLQVLQERWDPTFSEHSYGFRPGRSQRQAVARAQEYIAEGNRIVVDLDLEKFFDRVNHDILMGRVAKREKDKRVLKLIRAFLNAGVVMEDGVVIPTEEGTPQGGPLSPLLSNLMLDDLDRELERRGHRFARYADDCNIYVRTERAGQRVMESISGFITKKLKLKVNREKSAVAVPWQRKFLGFSFTSEKAPRRRIAPKARERFKERVRELTRRNRGISMAKRISDLAQYLRGWMGYFGYCETPSVFKELDAWIRRRLRGVQWKQWKTCKGRYKGLRKLGIVEPELHMLACCSRGPWPISGYSILTRALPNVHFDQLGLPRLIVLYRARA